MPRTIPVCVCLNSVRCFFVASARAANGVSSRFCFSNYLTSSLDREGAPGGPAGFTYRQGRGRLPLLHSRGVWGERASVPPGKGRPANGACFAEVISLESRGGMSSYNARTTPRQKRPVRQPENTRGDHDGCPRSASMRAVRAAAARLLGAYARGNRGSATATT